jgi:hypothetical protein
MFTRTRLGAIIAIVLGAITVLSLAGSASATSSPSAAQLPPTVMAIVSNSKVSVASLFQKKVTVLADMLLKAGVNPSSPKCFWTKPGQHWQNGGYGVDGTQFVDEHVPGKLCPSSHSGTGWVKVAGGHTGRHCFNAAIPPGHRMRPTVKGRVIWVHSLAKLHFTVRLNLTAVARGYCGEASAHLRVRQTFGFRWAMKSKGRTVVRFYLNTKDRVSGRAKAHVHCDTTVVVITPPECTSNCHPQEQVCADTGASNYGGPLPCVYPPPDCHATNTCQPPPCKCQQASPPSATVDYVQEIDASDFSVDPPITYTTPIRAHVSAKPGDSLTVTFASRYGSWPSDDSEQEITSTGTDTVTATYQSPTEPGTEQIEVLVFDNATGLSYTAYSNEFEVMKPPPPPE